MAEREGLGLVPEVRHRRRSAHHRDALDIQRQLRGPGAGVLDPDDGRGIDGVGLRPAVGAGIGIDEGLLRRGDGEAQGGLDRGRVQNAGPVQRGGDIKRHGRASSWRDLQVGAGAAGGEAPMPIRPVDIC